MTDDSEVVLRVRDTGAGMSEKELQTALEPFRQLATAARWGSSGTGLGLPITKALAEANHARFRITSQRRRRHAGRSGLPGHPSAGALIPKSDRLLWMSRLVPLCDRSCWRFSFGAPALRARAAEPVDLLLVLAADVSRSVDSQKFQLQREGYAAAIANPRVLDAIRAGRNGRIGVLFLEWSGLGNQKVVIDWMID